MQKYIVTAEGEGRLDIVNRITILFMQRHIAVESLTFEPADGLMYRYQVCALSDEDAIRKVTVRMEHIEGLKKISYK